MVSSMVAVREHLRSAEEFYKIGLMEYEEGKRSGDLLRMREGCEKVFHAYVEASSALIQKHGFPEPESHADRIETLYKLGEKDLIEAGDQAFLYLHKYAYYDWRILPKADESIKSVKETLSYVRRKTAR
jgi:hypothetical protein